MRIVQRTKDKGALHVRLTKGLGVAAGIFSLVVCILMIANNLRLKATDPIHMPALERMMREYDKNPDNMELQQAIREMDQLARMAFFNGQRFNRLGVYFLLGGLLVMVGCFKYQWVFKEEPPLPDGLDPKDDIVKDAEWTRWAIGSVGLSLVAFALVLAFTTESRLKEPEKLEDVVIPTLADLQQNWPAFRGVGGLGFAHVAAAPTEWNAVDGSGIQWKTKLPRKGFNSPIAWDGRLFMAGADELVREVYCVDTADGKILWTKKLSSIQGSPDKAPEVQSDTGHAAATMTTDGHRVFAIFANGDIAGIDFDGNQVWGRNLGVPDNPYGHCSSLVVYKDFLLVQLDHGGGGKLFGLDVRNGQTRWEVKRDFGASWSSPLLIENGDKPELIVTANPAVISYDPLTGAELWRLDCLGGEPAPTPIYADGLVYVASDYIRVAAIDITTHQIVWETDMDIPGVCSPLVTNGLIIYGLSDGGISCRDAKTGEEVWFEETDEGFYASPILVGDQIYMMDRGGTMHIFAAAREFKSLGKPVLDEQAVCTPIFLDGSIYYRAYENLYRIGKDS